MKVHRPLGLAIVHLLPWLPMVILFVLRAKGHREVCWLLAPGALAALVMYGLIPRAIPPLASTLITSFNMVGGTVAVVWLMLDWLARRRWYLRLPVVLASIVLVAATGAILGQFERDVPTAYGSATLTLLVGIGLAGLLTRGRFQPQRFMLHLLVWCIVVDILAVPLIHVVLCAAVYGASPGAVLSNEGPAAMIQGAVAGLAIFLALIPLMLVTFKVSFFREGFLGVFGIQQGEGKCE